VIPLTLAEIAAAVDGRLVDGARPDLTVSGPVATDSRDAAAGGLFVARRGENLDGHDFADTAIRAGAVAVLGERPVGHPAIIVPDSTQALARLAHEVFNQLHTAAVVGVTGSSGKTSTKDLIAELIGRMGPTIAPVGSFNNETGLPLTVLRADESTRYLVIEVGARGKGHIASLCRIAPPNIGVVLNVGSAHLGEFGSRSAIAEAKGELVEALPDDGVAILNADDPLVIAMRSRTVARVVTFGEAKDADVRAVDVRLAHDARASFRLVTANGSADVELRLHGAHHVSNALAAAAVASELGMDVERIAAVLSSAEPRSHWRMEVRERGDGVTIINDAYNANPESMAAALRALTAISADRRAWAVLGKMAELGPASHQAHKNVGRLAVALGVARIVVVGNEASGVRDGALAEGMSEEEVVLVPDLDVARSVLGAQLRAGDVVLVKASRSAGLERLALALLDGAGDPT
jgi:UDP-N-acetylmuramoyl-tripeptide--D-alanyl-D-alanine ligase